MRHLTAGLAGRTMGAMRRYWQYVFGEAAFGAARFASAAEVIAS